MKINDGQTVDLPENGDALAKLNASLEENDSNDQKNDLEKSGDEENSDEENSDEEREIKKRKIEKEISSDSEKQISSENKEFEQPQLVNSKPNIVFLEKSGSDKQNYTEAAIEEVVSRPES